MVDFLHPKKKMKNAGRNRNKKDDKTRLDCNQCINGISSYFHISSHQTTSFFLPVISLHVDKSWSDKPGLTSLTLKLLSIIQLGREKKRS